MNQKKVLVLGAGLLLLGVCVWFLFPDPEAAPPDDAANLLLEAQELQRMGEFRRAAAKYEEVLQKDPKAYDARVGLGLTLQAMGYNRRAVDVLMAASENKVENVNLDRALSRALLSTGKRGKAISILEPDFQKSGDPSTGLLLGDAFYEAERFDDAESIYRKLFQKGAPSAKLILRLHRTLLMNGKDADQFLSEVNPSGDLRGLMESSNLRWKGDLAGAFARLNQDSPVFQRRKLRLLLEMGKYKEVLPLAETLQSRSRKRPAITFRADAGVAKLLALLLLDRFSEAQTFSELQLKELDPRITSIGGALAAFRHVVGETKEAEYLQEVKDEPGSARNDHHLFLAVLARSRGDRTSCNAFLEKARQDTILHNDPFFLIERLRKRTD